MRFNPAKVPANEQQGEQRNRQTYAYGQCPSTLLVAPETSRPPQRSTQLAISEPASICLQALETALHCHTVKGCWRTSLQVVGMLAQELMGAQ